MFTFAKVVIHEEDAASRNVIVPIERLPAPGEELALANGDIVTVQVVAPDPEQPERVSLYSTRA
jgi:hypothetical protein